MLYSHFISTAALSSEGFTSGLFNTANFSLGINSDVDYIVLGAVSQNGAHIYPLFCSRPRFVHVGAPGVATGELTLCPASVAVGMVFPSPPAALIIATESRLPPIVTLSVGRVYTGYVGPIFRGLRYGQFDATVLDSATGQEVTSAVHWTLDDYPEITDEFIRTTFVRGYALDGTNPKPPFVNGDMAGQ